MANLWRVMTIATVVLRHRLHTLVPAHALPTRAGRWLLRALQHLLPADADSNGRRLRQTLTQLGPIFVKFGQLLSTRRDLLDDALARELAQLQDRVPPFPGEQARALIEAALDAPVAQAFASFDITPLASASIAQVHTATLPDGAEVVVKIVRPGIEALIDQDLRLLRRLADLADTYVAEARRLRLPEVVADYGHTIRDELNLQREAANTIRLRRNFAGSDALYVPRIHAQFTRRNMLVMERIYGVPVSAVDKLHDRGTNLKLLAERGVQTFFTQVFVHNFFHADMHPGNVFVDASNPDDPHYIALDCAIIGTLTEEDQQYLAQNLLAFFNRDYGAVVRLHLDSGWVPPDTNPHTFEAVIREVCDPIFEKPLAEISFGQFVMQLFRTAGEFNMEIQPQLVLLQKTLLYIEGVGRQLYPQLDLWSTGKPFIERWVAERLSPVATLRRLAGRAPELLERLPRLPELLLDGERRMRRLQFAVEQQQRQLQDLARLVDRRARRTAGRRAAGAALVALAALLLWRPLTGAAGADDTGMLAAVLSALLGSVLLLKA